MRDRDVIDLAAQIDALMAEYPEMAEDDELRAGMLEGSTSLPAVMDRIAEGITQAQGVRDGLSGAIKRLTERRARFERQEEVLRALAHRILDRADLPRFVGIRTFSISAPVRSVDVYDEDAIPEAMVRVKRSPDKAAIRAALDAGTDVPGARLSNGTPALRVI